MSILGIIPARYASTRFPGKPLADIMGRAMILRVYDQAMLAGVLDDVVVATDDDRIFKLVTNAGFNGLMTSTSHRSGTDRCLEALEIWQEKNHRHFECVINIQGDEPFIHPGQIKQVAAMLTDGHASIATLAKRITLQDELFNPNVVKVVFNHEMNAVYFSRCPIPFLREVDESDWITKNAHYKHTGIYGYRAEILRTACNLPQGTLEQLESLEQLRWLEHGLQIRIDITSEESIAIDTPDDLLKITNTA